MSAVYRVHATEFRCAEYGDEYRIYWITAEATDSRWWPCKMFFLLLLFHLSRSPYTMFCLFIDLWLWLKHTSFWFLFMLQSGSEINEGKSQRCEISTAGIEAGQEHTWHVKRLYLTVKRTQIPPQQQRQWRYWLSIWVQRWTLHRDANSILFNMFSQPVSCSSIPSWQYLKNPNL